MREHNINTVVNTGVTPFHKKNANSYLNSNLLLSSN